MDRGHGIDSGVLSQSVVIGRLGKTPSTYGRYPLKGGVGKGGPPQYGGKRGKRLTSEAKLIGPLVQCSAEASVQARQGSVQRLLQWRVMRR